MRTTVLCFSGTAIRTSRVVEGMGRRSRAAAGAVVSTVASGLLTLATGIVAESAVFNVTEAGVKVWLTSIG